MHGGDVVPALVILTHEHQFTYVHSAQTGKLCPSLARDGDGLSRLLILLGFDDRQMRDVDPTFRAAETIHAELVVQFAQAIGKSRDLDEDSRRGWEKGLHIA